eukprot:318365-Chlamydomonas_euryale.AAC.5
MDTHTHMHARHTFCCAIALPGARHCLTTVTPHHSTPPPFPHINPSLAHTPQPIPLLRHRPPWSTASPPQQSPGPGSWCWASRASAPTARHAAARALTP